MSFDGAPLENAVEGLGYDASAGTLLQGFWRAGANNSATSNSIASHAMDGSLVGAVAFGSDVDFDGLAMRDATGSMYFVDREPGPNTVEIGVVTHGGPRTSLIVYGFSAELNGVNDVTPRRIGEICWRSMRSPLLFIASTRRPRHSWNPGRSAPARG